LDDVVATGGALNEFPATLKRGQEPGTFNRYNSADAQVLGMLLVAVTGRSIADYMQESSGIRSAWKRMVTGSSIQPGWSGPMAV
jgi:hypothetical protein